MAEEIGDPLGVLRIGLASRDRLDVAGIDDQQTEVRPFEQVVDRLPVDARGFHRDVGHAQTEQPVGQREQLVGDRTERPQLTPSGMMTLATTVSRWMSSPAQRSLTTSKIHLRVETAAGAATWNRCDSSLRASRAARATIRGASGRRGPD